MAEADAHDAGPGLAALRAAEPALVSRVEATLDRVRRELFY
jgi:hypothetical protein